MSEPVNLSAEEITTLTALADTTIANFGTLQELMDRYEEIYFMTRGETPKGVDEKDIKETLSTAGRDAVTGMKRILDTSDIQIKVKNAPNADKIEAGLKKILQVSGRIGKGSRLEKDLNLSAVLFGPVILGIETVEDLITAQKGSDYEAEYAKKQLENIKKEVPVIMRVINPKQSFPIWGSYGMIGHIQKFKIKGAEVRERWGKQGVEDVHDYEIIDIFHYSKRLTICKEFSEPLFSGEWVVRDDEGKIMGGAALPIHVRFSGGTSLFNEPEKQMQALLYGMAKGNWDLRDNLFWSYLFTALYTQGMPGPLLVIKPENASQKIVIKNNAGFRTVVADAQIADPQIIDGDVLRVRELMDRQFSVSTVQPQTLGENTANVTFSQFIQSSKSGLLPAQDPKESIEQICVDGFTHILQRIKDEDIQNDLIPPKDITDNFEIEVTLEPDLAQDDLRNAQVATGLKNSGANVSDEWINTNVLKIANSEEMWKQKSKEDMRKAILASMLQDPQWLKSMMMQATGVKEQPPQTNPNPAEAGGGGGEIPSGPDMEGLPQTDAMIPASERT